MKLAGLVELQFGWPLWSTVFIEAFIDLFLPLLHSFTDEHNVRNLPCAFVIF